MTESSDRGSQRTRVLSVVEPLGHRIGSWMDNVFKTLAAAIVTSPSSVADSPLGDWLCQDHFLVKVLDFLVDDGLHECRLVCRTWKAVCDQMPVKIRLSPRSSLERAAKQFPSVAYLCLDGCSSPNISRPHDWQPSLDEALLADISLLKGLTSLESVGVCIPTEPPSNWFLVGSLKSLILHPTRRTRDGDLCGLRFLTNLTRLHLGNIEWGGQPRLQIFSELCSIQDLKIPGSFLADHEGQLMFPSLTSLSRLSFGVTTKTVGSLQGRIFQTVSTYASSLEALEISFWENHQLQSDMSYLAELTRLESFSANFIMNGEAPLGRELGELPYLTDLRVSTRGASTQPQSSFFVTVSAMKDLKSLSLAGVQTLDYDTFVVAPLPLNELTQLTKLVCMLPPKGWQVESLGQLRCLDIELDTEEAAACDFYSSLQKLPHLETLHIVDRASSWIVSDAFSGLCKLRCLKLALMEKIRKDPFQQLTSLTKLTELELSCSLADSVEPTYAYLNLLSKLSTLKIFMPTSRESGDRSQAVKCLKGENFPHLRYLNLHIDPLATPFLKPEAMKRFPVLRYWAI